jgi:hypothetical protein
MRSSGGKELMKLFSGMGINGPFKEYPPELSIAAAYGAGYERYRKVYEAWDAGQTDVWLSLGILVSYY